MCKDGFTLPNLSQRLQFYFIWQILLIYFPKNHIDHVEINTHLYRNFRARDALPEVNRHSMIALYGTHKLKTIGPRPGALSRDN